MNGVVNILSSITLLLVVKWLLVAMFSVYTIFAYLMLRQVKVMMKAVKMKDGYLVKALAIAHLLFALFVLAMSILIL